MSRIFICPLCKNSDPKFIGYINGKPYCRKCVSFCGEETNYAYQIKDNLNLTINYKLTAEQQEISKNILINYKNKYNQLVYAVCGAGKTELVFEVIDYCLKNKLKVGFAIPRKDVVIELANRFKSSFKNANIISIYGGHTKEINGDIICLTTHQLFRFNKYFDLLILDELDAFPYKDNDVLYQLFLRSIKGNYILMSATPSKKILHQFETEKDKKILKLFVRFHHNPIPIPIIKIVFFDWLKIIFIVYKIRKYIAENKPVLIFVPTREYSKKLYFLIKNLAKPGYFVNSLSKNRQEIIDNFRCNKLKYLITTSILERGVTLPNLQVIIFKSDHDLYSKEALVQIGGRVGRKAEFPNGEVIFLSDKKTKEMVEAISQINEANKCLQMLSEGYDTS